MPYMEAAASPPGRPVGPAPTALPTNSQPLSAEQPISTTIPIPNLSHITLHAQIRRLSLSNTIFLTSTSEISSAPGLSALGSFVYAMPNVPSLQISQSQADIYVPAPPPDLRGPLHTSLYVGIQHRLRHTGCQGIGTADGSADVRGVQRQFGCRRGRRGDGCIASGYRRYHQAVGNHSSKWHTQRWLWCSGRDSVT